MKKQPAITTGMIASPSRKSGGVTRRASGGPATIRAAVAAANSSVYWPARVRMAARAAASPSFSSRAIRSKNQGTQARLAPAHSMKTTLPIW